MSSIDTPILNTPFRILAQQQTPEIMGPTLVREVVEVTALEVLHEVVFLVRVPLLDWKDGLTAAFVSPIADAIYVVMNQPSVVAADFVQVPDPAGRIHDFLEITVSPDGGDNSASFRQPIARLDMAEVGPKIDALLVTLSTTAALT